jgi:hypothetical protein
MHDFSRFEHGKVWLHKFRNLARLIYRKTKRKRKYRKKVIRACRVRCDEDAEEGVTCSFLLLEDFNPVDPR